MKTEKNRVQATPVTKFIATIVFQEAILYIRYPEPWKHTSPRKLPCRPQKRNVSKELTVSIGCQGLYIRRTVYVHVHPSQGARICPTQRHIASKGSARVTKRGDVVKNEMNVNAHTLKTMKSWHVVESTATATTQTGNGLVWPKTKILHIQMKVLEPKWNQEQRRSLQNKVDKYTNLCFERKRRRGSCSSCTPMFHLQFAVLLRPYGDSSLGLN